MQRESEELLATLRELMAQVVERREMPRLFKYPEAARLLSISPSKLKGLIRCGLIVPTVLGRTRMISLSEIERVAAPSSAPPVTAPRKTRASQRAFSADAEVKRLKKR